MTARRFHIVQSMPPKPSPPPEQRVDIYAADKALAASIDWSVVHIAGDHRSRIVDLPDRPRRSGLERRR